MNSAPEENDSELQGDSNANSSANVEQSFDQKGNGPREHAKPRRRRRGKKRKQKKESAATCEAENLEECESELHLEIERETRDDSKYREWDSDENLSCEAGPYNDVILRPINVPSAPLNSTQFIIDDHNDCTFYMSFETPNPYGVSTHSDSHSDGIEGDIVEPTGNDAAYIDIDYQYESPQDFDNTAYYDKEFEQSYKNSRIEEFQRLARTELISRLETLESHYKELTENLMKQDPNPILEKLQAELLVLQEKNSLLKEENSKLAHVLQNEANCSEALGCQTVSKSMAVSSVSRLDESKKNALYMLFSAELSKMKREECSESNEVVMSDLNTDPVTLKDTCEKNCDSRISQNEIEDERLTGHKEVGDHCIGHNKVNEDNYVDHCGVDGIHHTDDGERVRGNQIKHEEVSDQPVEADSSLQDNLDIWNVVSGNLNSQPGSVCRGTTVTNSEGLQTNHTHSNSRKMLHCQPNNLDDLRTLNISPSELFHITNQTKCSSLVPVEGGMSPSETSVN